MILSDKDIHQAVEFGHIIISPFSESQLNPNSYNLTLADTLLHYTSIPLDSKKENYTESLKIPESGIVLNPGCLYLGSTIETAGSTKYVPVLEGRSSFGRLGLDVHISAGFGDCGWIGNWTLELRVVHPLRIYSSQQICQVVFHTLTSPPEKPYTGKYNGSKTVVASRLFTEY